MAFCGATAQSLCGGEAGGSPGALFAAVASMRLCNFATKLGFHGLFFFSTVSAFMVLPLGLSLAAVTPLQASNVSAGSLLRLCLCLEANILNACTVGAGELGGAESV